MSTTDPTPTTNKIRIEFGVLLRQHITRKGFSLRGFARQSGMTVSTLSQIVNGKRTPPLTRVPLWIELLTPDTRQRDDLSLLAYLSHASPEVVTLVMNLRQQVSQLEAENQRLLAALGCVDSPMDFHAALLDCMACRTSRRELRDH